MSDEFRLRNFWNVFMEAHDKYVKAGQSVVEKRLRETLDPILVRHGVNPRDFKIIWKRPEVEYDSLRSTKTEGS